MRKEERVWKSKKLKKTESSSHQYMNRIFNELYSLRCRFFNSHLSMRFSITFYSVFVYVFTVNIGCNLNSFDLPLDYWIEDKFPPAFVIWTSYFYKNTHTLALRQERRKCKIKMKIELLHTKTQSIFTIVRF